MAWAHPSGTERIQGLATPKTPTAGSGEADARSTSQSILGCQGAGPRAISPLVALARVSPESIDQATTCPDLHLLLPCGCESSRQSHVLSVGNIRPANRVPPPLLRGDFTR